MQSQSNKEERKALFKNRINEKDRQKNFQDIIDWTCDFKILPIVLRAFDRLSMSQSVESRAPFMDYRLVEVFKKIPIQYKVNYLGNKAILREILKKYHLDFIYKDKAKMGFATDVNVFFSQDKNIKEAKRLIDNFDYPQLNNYKNKALDILNNENLSWYNIADIQKVSLISLTDELYTFEDNNE